MIEKKIDLKKVKEDLWPVVHNIAPSEEKSVPVIYDKTAEQFRLKIPKKMAEAVGLATGSVAYFCIDYEKDKKPKLKVEFK